MLPKILAKPSIDLLKLNWPFNFMQTLLACLHVDAVFMFTQGGYCTVEGTGPLVVTVKMAPSSGILGNPVQVKVQTVPAGDAVGEYGSD